MTPRRGSVRWVALAALSAALWQAGSLDAQTVQYVRSLAAPETQLSLRQKEEKLERAVRIWTERLDGEAAALTREEAVAIQNLVRLATEALVSRDEGVVDQKIVAMLAIENRTMQKGRPGTTPALPLADLLGGSTLSPISHLLLPDVVFGMGAAWISRGSSHSFDFGLGTNLLGAGVGTALGAVGSDKLKEYMLNNMVVGFAVPTGKGARFSGQLSLGLGGLPLIKRRLVWAVLNLDQLQAEDERVPREAAQRDTNARFWTSPTLSLGFSPWSLEETKKRMKKEDLTFVITFGVSAPHYYPDHAFKALAAMFTDDRKNFVRAGEVRYSVGLYVPFLPGPSTRKATN